MQKQFDAIVIGGGPAGATSAAVLAQAGWNVAIIEQKEFPRRKVCGEFLSLTNWPVLEQLGLDRAVQTCAGPEVTHMAVFTGSRAIRAELPMAYGRPGHRGRALTRDVLDTLLMERSKALGATIIQPVKVRAVIRESDGFSCELESRETRETSRITSKIMIAANGSWEANPLGEAPKKAPRGSDLFGFKAHFRNAHLPDGLMPLLSFDDGYGGMVHCQDGLTSLSCCVTRKRLSQLRQQTDAGAGEQLLEHIRRTCPAIIPVLKDAVREGPWLSAGPLQTGIRPRYTPNVFYVGNAAAEAHPVIAEGISIAIQSGWMMASMLVPAKERLDDQLHIDSIGRAYSDAWSRAFSTRIRSSALIAHWAMRPWLVQLACPVFERWPRVLNWCAEMAGKASLSFQPRETLTKVAQ
ncbi:MAG: NAD(P)/FAD-dependent oxidoreductase [Planctomycetota bacterium]